MFRTNYFFADAPEQQIIPVDEQPLYLTQEDFDASDGDESWLLDDYLDDYS
jgi:hypothetical protein